MYGLLPGLDRKFPCMGYFLVCIFYVLFYMLFPSLDMLRVLLLGLDSALP